MRGVLFCAKEKCAVFYSVLRGNARCFILCDTLCIWTAIGDHSFHIFINRINDISSWFKTLYLSSPIGVQLHKVSAKLRGVLVRLKGKCAVFYSVWHPVYLDTYREHSFDISNNLLNDISSWFKTLYLSSPIGVQLHQVSAKLRGVLFRVKGKCVVFFYSLWHPVYLDTYREHSYLLI